MRITRIQVLSANDYRRLDKTLTHQQLASTHSVFPIISIIVIRRATAFLLGYICKINEEIVRDQSKFIALDSFDSALAED